MLEYYLTIRMGVYKVAFRQLVITVFVLFVKLRVTILYTYVTKKYVRNSNSRIGIIVRV